MTLRWDARREEEEAAAKKRASALINSPEDKAESTSTDVGSKVGGTVGSMFGGMGGGIGEQMGQSEGFGWMDHAANEDPDAMLMSFLSAGAGDMIPVGTKGEKPGKDAEDKAMLKKRAAQSVDGSGAPSLRSQALSAEQVTQAQSRALVGHIRQMRQRLDQTEDIYSDYRMA